MPVQLYVFGMLKFAQMQAAPPQRHLCSQFLEPRALRVQTEVGLVTVNHMHGGKGDDALDARRQPDDTGAPNGLLLVVTPTRGLAAVRQY